MLPPSEVTIKPAKQPSGHPSCPAKSFDPSHADTKATLGAGHNPDVTDQFARASDGAGTNQDAEMACEADANGHESGDAQGRPDNREGTAHDVTMDDA